MDAPITITRGNKVTHKYRRKCRNNSIPLQGRIPHICERERRKQLEHEHSPSRVSRDFLKTMEINLDKHSHPNNLPEQRRES